RALDLEDERAQVRRDPEDLEVPLAEAALRIERRLEQPRRRPLRARHLERHRLRAGSTVGPPPPSTAGPSQLNGAQRHDATQRLFEHTSHEGNVLSLVERARERAE